MIIFKQMGGKMKKILYRMLTISIIISLLLPVFCQTTYAIDEEERQQAYENIYPYNVVNETNPGALNEAEEKGTSTVTVGGTDDDTAEQPQTTSLDPGSSIFDAVIGVICGLFLIPIQLLSYLMTSAAENTFIHSFDNCFTIQKCVAGEYDLFDIDIFDTNPTEGKYKDLHGSIRPNIQLWYVAFRNLAIVLCAIIVIYIGLRMALATVAEAQAKYKKMFTNWLISLCLLFLMHFLIYGLLYVSKIITKVFKEAMEAMETDFSEEELVGNMFTSVWKAKGAQKFGVVVMIYVLVYHELKYFILFLTRMIHFYYLVAISPLVTVTYSLDKMKDSKAQAFSQWLNNIINEIFLGPIECLVYIIFVFTAGVIMSEVPLLAIIMIISMGQGEKAIKKVLGIRARRGITSFGIMALLLQPVKMFIGGRGGGAKGGGGAGGPAGAS